MTHVINIERTYVCYKQAKPESRRKYYQMKLIFIVGSWGSGTTAVIGALDSIGVPTLGPYFQSSDPKTLNTFELISFRNLINQYVDEPMLKHKDNYLDEFMPALEKYRLELEDNIKPDLQDNPKKVIALKMPLASICLPEICSTFETKIIVVHRTLEEIEASRLRRNWPPLYGALGAKHIYGRVFNDLIQHKLSFLGISYHDFVNNTCESLKKIIKYCEIEYLQENLKNAEKFVKPP